MAFDRLQGLGEARFTKIRNELLRGIPAMALARTIQMEWGEFTDVAEKSLTQQLNRLRIAMEEEAFGEETADSLERSSPRVRVNILGKEGTLNPLEEMEDIIRKQKRRIKRFLDKEEASNNAIPILNEIIKDQFKMIQDYQKARFDLGIDEFQGVIPGMKTISASATLPDGTTIQKSVYEAVNLAEKILAGKSPQLPIIEVPHLIEGEITG